MRGVSRIAVVAALSLIAFVGAFAWQIFRTDESAISTSPSNYARSADETEYFIDNTLLDSATSSAEDAAESMGDTALGGLIGSYIAMKQMGTYTDEQGKRVAEAIAEGLRADIPFTEISGKDIRTVSDTSYASVLSYRADLRAALAPLLENQEAEFVTFARYIETGDRSNLDELSASAQRYRKAAANAAAIAVPKDAASYHVDAVNALLSFAATLDSIVQNADDPMATLAFLRAYNDSAAAVLTSFNSLAAYQKRKIP